MAIIHHRLLEDDGEGMEAKVTTLEKTDMPGLIQMQNWSDVEDASVNSLVYKDKTREVKGISIRWLSKYGDDGKGSPEYGLRFFTAEPAAEIPIHSHLYHQTVYILSGRFESWEFDAETDELVRTKICGKGDFIYVPSWVPHGMKNMSETEPATFLCCICNVYDAQDPGL